MFIYSFTIFLRDCWYVLVNTCGCSRQNITSNIICIVMVNFNKANPCHIQWLKLCCPKMIHGKYMSKIYFKYCIEINHIPLESFKNHSYDFNILFLYISKLHIKKSHFFHIWQRLQLFGIWKSDVSPYILCFQCSEIFQ